MCPIEKQVALSPRPLRTIPPTNIFEESEEENEESSEEENYNENNETSTDSNVITIESDDEDEVVPQMETDGSEHESESEHEVTVPQVNIEKGKGVDVDDDGGFEKYEDEPYTNPPMTTFMSVPPTMPTAQTTGTMEAGPSLINRGDDMRGQVATLELELHNKENSEAALRIKTEDYMRQAHRWEHGFQCTTFNYQHTLTAKIWGMERVVNQMESGVARNMVMEVLDRAIRDAGRSWEYEQNTLKWARKGE